MPKYFFQDQLHYWHLGLCSAVRYVLLLSLCYLRNKSINAKNDKHVKTLITGVWCIFNTLSTYISSIVVSGPKLGILPVYFDQDASLKFLIASSELFSEVRIAMFNLQGKCHTKNSMHATAFLGAKVFLSSSLIALLHIVIPRIIVNLCSVSV